MSNTNPSTNMNMPVPIVGQETGPEWASDINACLNILDSHSHSSGSGVPITPSGLSINADLTYNNNNITNVRSLRLYPQSAVLSDPLDLGCLYEVDDDLYYNDGAGNQVRITQSGGVAGSPGSISNLASPASASYVSANSTFVWQSAANTPASMDGGSVILRNISANSKGLTLNPPNAMGSNYSLVLPSLPVQTNIMTLDTSGNIGASLNVDNSTLQWSSNTLSIKDAGVTRTQLAAVGQQISSSCGSFQVSTFSHGSSAVAITNLSVTITTTGRPVIIALIPDGTSNSANIFPTIGSGTLAQGFLYYYMDGSSIGKCRLGAGTVGGIQSYFSPFMHITVPSAGSHTFEIYGATNGSANASVYFEYLKLFVYEL